MRHRELAPQPGVDPRADALAGRLRALADPLRLRLAGLLAHGPCPVTAIAAALGVGQSLVSFHLGELERAGLVRLERVGRYTYPSLNPAGVQALFNQAADLLGLLAAARPALTEPGRAEPAGPARELVAPTLAELSDQFAGMLGADRVERVLVEEATRLHAQGRDLDRDAAAVGAQHAAQRLRAIAQTERRLPKQVPEVLFVCVHNAARSQMAAALANRLGQGRVHAWSAGSQPAQALQPQAVEVMAEIGINLTGQAPKPWTNDLVRAADIVVTMGCGEAIPTFPGVRYVAWQIPDPAGQPLAHVRGIRDQLTDNVRALLADLDLAPDGSTNAELAPPDPATS